jgi:hypothetical protein
VEKRLLKTDPRVAVVEYASEGPSGDELRPAENPLKEPEDSPEGGSDLLKVGDPWARDLRDIGDVGTGEPGEAAL